MNSFSGKVLFLNRSDINTDEIIPAKYLTEISKEAMAPHLLEDLVLKGFDPADIKNCQVVVTRDNFGCGSSREHAVWALEANDIRLVIAPSFARIFRQNTYNCGLLAVELAADEIDQIFNEFAGRPTELTADLNTNTFTLTAEGRKKTIDFTISGFDRDLVKAGGWVEYADANY
jgi:3-isopropylmalate/(R)-2-methylmalate dehydratase small subunit